MRLPDGRKSFKVGLAIILILILILIILTIIRLATYLLCISNLLIGVFFYIMLRVLLKALNLKKNVFKAISS